MKLLFAAAVLCALFMHVSANHLAEASTADLEAHLKRIHALVTQETRSGIVDQRAVEHVEQVVEESLRRARQAFQTEQGYKADKRAGEAPNKQELPGPHADDIIDTKGVDQVARLAVQTGQAQKGTASLGGKTAQTSAEAAAIAAAISVAEAAARAAAKAAHADAHGSHESYRTVPGEKAFIIPTQHVLHKSPTTQELIYEAARRAQAAGQNVEDAKAALMACCGIKASDSDFHLQFAEANGNTPKPVYKGPIGGPPIGAAGGWSSVSPTTASMQAAFTKCMPQLRTQTLLKGYASTLDKFEVIDASQQVVAGMNFRFTAQILPAQSRRRFLSKCTAFRPLSGDIVCNGCSSAATA